MRIEPATKVLVDTNVLLEATDEGRPFHLAALEVFKRLPEEGVDLFLATQVVREYLVVATRPVENNGLGMSAAHALDNLRSFRRRTSLIAETEQASEIFLGWIERFRTRGKKLHDLQLLATAHTAGLDALLTANPGDFPAKPPLSILPLSGVFDPGSGMDDR